MYGGLIWIGAGYLAMHGGFIVKSLGANASQIKGFIARRATTITMQRVIIFF